MRLSLLLPGIALFCGLLVVENRTANAQQPQFQNIEYRLKAGYFVYFGRYVTWPNPPFAGADKTFVIGILGNNPFGQNLVATPNGSTINVGKLKVDNIQGKRISVVQYKSVAEFQRNFSPCHILFICRTSTPGVQGETAVDRVNAALKKTKGQPVLLVAEAINMNTSRNFAKAGITISYWNNNQTRQVNMIINRTAEKRERLNISSRLLGLHLVKVL